MTESSETTVPARWHDLDAVRALALLLGVVLHGVMAYMAPRVWVVADSRHDIGFNIVFYVIHMFRMTTFFVLAGFFARMVMQKKGLGGFIGNRLLRIAVPLVVFWFPVLAAIITMLIVANPPVPGAPPSPPPALSVATFPLTHLWFLYVLLWFYAGAVVIKLVTDILHIGGVLGRLLDGLVGVLTRSDLISAVLILPVAFMVYTDDKWTMWFGVTTPDTGLVPNAMAMAAFVTAFAFGWWLNRQAGLIDHLARRVWVYGLGAAIGTWGCLALAGTSPVLTPVSGHDHPLYCLLYPLTTWSWTFLLIGLARRFLKGENPVIRYLADASYWVYIVHIPLVMGLQYAVSRLDWPAEPKFAVVLVGTMAATLVTYQLFVRYSFIGTILNGRRRKAKGKVQAREVPA